MCMCACARVCASVCACACMRVCVRVCVCVGGCEHRSRTVLSQVECNVRSRRGGGRVPANRVAPAPGRQPPRGPPLLSRRKAQYPSAMAPTPSERPACLAGWLMTHQNSASSRGCSPAAAAACSSLGAQQSPVPAGNANAACARALGGAAAGPAAPCKAPAPLACQLEPKWAVGATAAGATAAVVGGGAGGEAAGCAVAARRYTAAKLRGAPPPKAAAW